MTTTVQSKPTERQPPELSRAATEQDDMMAKEWEAELIRDAGNLSVRSPPSPVLLVLTRVC